VVYPHRLFRDQANVAAAIRILSEHVSRISYGRGHRDIPVSGSLADQAEELLTADSWLSFACRGQQVAGWSRGELVVHGSGPWDASLGEVPYTLTPWSWLDVGVTHARGGGHCASDDPLPQSVRHCFDEDELIAWFSPVDVDTISVFGQLASGRRSIRKLPDQLMVTEPITKELLNSTPADPALAMWWTDVLDRVGTKYRLGPRSNEPKQTATTVAPPPDDEVELRIELGRDRPPPEELLETISMELEKLGAEVDAWFTQGDCVCLPISGTGLPALLARGAGIARAAGYTVANPPQK
jgi:hypothetical protein